MPTRSYSFPQGNGELQIEISWKHYWRNIIVKVNGEIVHHIGSKKELDKGVTFFHHNNKYFAQIKLVFMTPQIVVEVNDRPIPGSANDPQTMVRNGFYMTFFLSGLNLLAGLATLTIDGNVDFLRNIGFGYYNISAAAIYLFSFVISKHFNLFAGLSGCFLFFLIDSVITLTNIVKLVPQSVSGIVITRLLFGTILFLACRGAYKLQGKLVSHIHVSLK